MTELENKILAALKEKNKNMAAFDADCQAEYNDYMRKANEQTEAYWKTEYTHKAEWVIGFQNHGYEFVEEWCNVIAQVIYGRIYHEWHSACPGKHGTGHGAYSTTELTTDEHKKVYKVFKGLVNQGYLKPSKSGYKAKLVK